MANEIALQKVLVDYGAALEAQLPIIALANSEISDKFGDDQGETIYAKLRNLGTTYKTDDLTGKMSDIKTEGVPLSLAQYKKGLSLSMLEDTLEAGGDIDAVIKDNSAEMADVVGGDFYATALLGAASTHVSTGTFGDLAVLSMMVGKSRMAGAKGGVLSPEVHTAVRLSGMNQAFSAAPALSSKLYQGVIGNFSNTNFVEAPIDFVETAGIFPAGTITLASTVMHFTPTASVGTAVNIKKGTVVTAAGVYGVDMFGRSTGILRSFVVQADVTIPTGTGGVDVNFGEVLVAGPRKNVSVAVISAVAITNKLEANARYATGVVFVKNELMLGMKGIKPLRNGNSTTQKNTAGLPLRITYDGSAKTSTNDIIMDLLAGSAVYARRACSSIYVRQQA